MRTLLKTLLAVWNTLKNKLIALAVLFVLAAIYRNLPQDQPIPFAELLYAVILVSAVTILAPVMRLLVFPEVASYAEGTGLKEDLDGSAFHPALIHYWIVTVICYATSMLCISSLLSH